MNHIELIRCPKCRAKEQVDVLAFVWVRLTTKGVVADLAACGDVEFDHESPATCRACSYEAEFWVFHAKNDEIEKWAQDYGYG